MKIALTLLVLILLFLVLETGFTRRNVSRIGLRVHVNGTRGKSTVTEYIAAGLRSSGKKTFAKITGVQPTLILPGGEKRIIKRRGTPRVQEQFKIIQQAVQSKAQSLVLECMSISPDLQQLESRVFRPHLYIITNIKDDHREKMGLTIQEQARAICEAIPEKCLVITNEIQFIEMIKDAAKAKSSRVITPGKLSAEFEELVQPGIYRGNIALAWAVCREAGIAPDAVLKGIREVNRQLQSPLIRVKSNTKQIHFLDGFAVNDVPSAEAFINHWQAKFKKSAPISVLLNTRADRPFRSLIFAEWLANSLPHLQRIILTGTHIYRTKRALVKAGIARNQILIWKERELKALKQNLLNEVEENAIVIGLGNIAGPGFQVRKVLAG